MKTLIIAEAGSTHDGNLAKALYLIAAAKETGADAVKFQWTSDPRALCARRGIDRDHPRRWTYLNAYTLIAFDRAMLTRLKDECDRTGIEFMCTVYRQEDIPVIAPLVERFKVASFSAVDRAFVAAHRQYGKLILISTGMMEESEVWRDMRSGVRLLHCVSAYPTPIEQANLAALRTVVDGDGYPMFSGYSDHTKHVLTGALAVAAGAEIVEVHFKHPETDPRNLDIAAALTVGELAQYVDLIRQAEVALGDGIKRPQEAEKSMMQYREHAH